MTFVFEQPALSEPYETWPAGVECMLAEMKYDGYRCLIHLGEDTVLGVYCRDPKQVGWAPNIKHIADELFELGFQHCLVDGEVMGNDWNKTGIVKKGFSGTKKTYTRPSDEEMAEIVREIKYYIFDWIDLEQLKYIETRAKKPVPVFGMALKDRRAELCKYMNGAAMKDIVRLSEQREVRSELDLDELVEEWKGPGCDGVMLKHPLSVYSFIKSKAWLKRKPVVTFEGKIIAYEMGAGKFASTLGAFVCVNEKGGEFRVGSFQCDDEYRAELWERKDALLGTFIECRRQDDDVAKVARHAVFVRLREDKTSF